MAQQSKEKQNHVVEKKPVQETGDIGTQESREAGAKKNMVEDHKNIPAVETDLNQSLIETLHTSSMIEHKGDNLHPESSSEQDRVVGVQEIGVDELKPEITKDIRDISGMENATNESPLKSLNMNPVMEEKGVNLQPEGGSVGACDSSGNHSIPDVILHTETRQESLVVAPRAPENTEEMYPENSSAKKPHVQQAAENEFLALHKRADKHCKRKRKKEKTEVKTYSNMKFPSLHKILVLLVQRTFSALTSVEWSCWLRLMVLLLSGCALSSSSCSICQIHTFCTAENLLNQHLAISTAGKENYCSFQFTAHFMKEKCNKSAVILNETQMCVLLYMTDLTHNQLYLEYGTHRTPPIPAALEGCCDHSSLEADYSTQTGEAEIDHNLIPVLILTIGLLGHFVAIFVAYRCKSVGKQIDQTGVAIEIGQLGGTDPTGGSHQPDQHQSNGDIVNRENQENLLPGGRVVPGVDRPEQDHSKHNGDTDSPVGNPELNLSTSFSLHGEMGPRDDTTKPLLIHKEAHIGLGKSNENTYRCSHLDLC